MKRALIALAALLTLAAPAFAQKAAEGAADPTYQFSEEDAAMNAAIAEARRTLPQFLAEFDAAQAHVRENYLVKVGLPATTGNPEHIWVENLRRENGRLVGALANAPAHLPGLRLGSRVEIDEALISDWTIVTAQGMYGSFTTRVMLPHVDAQTAAQIRQTLAPTPLPPSWSS